MEALEVKDFYQYYLGDSILEGDMKKTLIVLMIAGFASIAYPLEVKILGGISISRSTEPLISGSPEVTLEGHKLGGTSFGAGLSFSLARYVDLEVDCLFLPKGAGATFFFEGQPVDIHHVRVNELSFPVLLKLGVTQGTGPYFIGGGELAWVLTRELENPELGMVFGIGIRGKVGKKAICLEGRYHLGMTDFRTSVRKIRTFVLLVGFSL